MKREERWKRARKKLASAGMGVACLVKSGVAYAADAGSVDSIMKPFLNTISGIGIVVGVGVTVFGAVQFGMSLPTHDPTQRAGGILAIAGGLLICFHKTILGAMGVTW